MEEFPSGQRGQTVNLLRFASVVRIHPPPPSRSKVRFAPTFLKVRARSQSKVRLPLPRLFQTGPAALGSGFLFLRLPPGGVPLAEAWNTAAAVQDQEACRAAVHRCGSPQVFPALWKNRSACGCLAARRSGSGPYSRTYVRVYSTMIPPISPDVKGAWGKNTNTVPKTGTDKSVRPG